MKCYGSRKKTNPSPSSSLASSFSSSPVEALQEILLAPLEKRTTLEPFTLGTFYSFLLYECSHENLHFFLECDLLQNPARSRVHPVFDNLLPPQHNQPERHVVHVYERYIKSGADQQVNIGHDQRLRIEKELMPLLSNTALSAGNEVKINPEVFAEAQYEVLCLMANDPFERFKDRFTNANMNTADVRWKYIHCVVLFMLSIVMSVLLIVLQVSRYFSFLILPLWHFGFGMLLSARTKVCPVKAYWGLALLDNATICQNQWTMFVKPGTRGSCQVSLQDPVVVANFRKRAKRHFIAALALAIIATLCVFGLSFIPQSQG